MQLLRKIIGFPFALLYDLITSIRNWLFDEDIFTSQSFDLPIISVGNLSIGGTGKTPHVEYIVKLLSENYSPAILSRGYKRQTSGYIFASTQSTVKQIGDEPLQYKLKHPNIAVAVGENRVLAVPQLLMDAPNTSAIILDDAFQHRAIQPGLSILLTDYANLYADDFILPAGNLRESKRGAKRANIVIVTKCPTNLTQQEAQTIQKKLNLQSHQSLYFSYVHYAQPYSFLQRGSFLETTDVEVLIATGIAKPNYLKQYVEYAYNNAFLLDFADHHQFQQQDIEHIHTLYQNLGDVKKAIFITEKDAVKFIPFTSELRELELPIYVQSIEVGILFNKQSELNTELINFVQNFYTHERTPSE